MTQALLGTNRQLHRLKERFLDGEDLNGEIRPEIQASWQRSLEAGVLPDRIVPHRAHHSEPASALPDLAEPVIDHHFDRLGSANTAILLADESARILTRWTADGAVNQALEQVGSVPGSCLAEELCGTNGLGTVFAERRPLQISGAEHYAECYATFACTGVPVCHPITGEVQGVITVVVRHGSENDLVLPFAQLLREAIERRMANQMSAGDRALLDNFLGMRRHSGHSVIAVSGRYLLAGPEGFSRLGDIEHEQLWARLTEELPPQSDAATTMILGETDGVAAQVRPVRWDSRLVGATVELPPETGEPKSQNSSLRDSRRSVAQRTDAVAQLPGQARRWVSATNEVRRVTMSGAPLLLVGEPGTGKLTLLHAAAASSDQPEPCDVFDAALIPVHGLARWLQRVRSRISVPNGWLVLRHAELLDERAGQALSAILDEHTEEVRPRIGATIATTEPACEPHLQPFLDRLSPVRIDIPPLRDRREDIPRIAKRILASLHPDGSRRWTEDALEALTSATWPDNLRQLHSTVHSMAVESGRLTTQRLPSEIRESKDASLPRLERVRREALLAALQEADGNKTAAAIELGISRSTLYRYLRTFGLNSC